MTIRTTRTDLAWAMIASGLWGFWLGVMFGGRMGW